MLTFPSRIPQIEVTASENEGPERIECQEMFGCLPRVGFEAMRAEYTYPDGVLTRVRQYRVQCQLVFAGLDVYEIAELPTEKNELPHLWYFGLSDKGVHCLRYVARYRHKVGHIDDYAELEEPPEPRVFESGYEREHTWTELSGNQQVSWRVSDSVRGPVTVTIGTRKYRGLRFESMVRYMNGRPIHLDTHFIDRSGRRILVRRWEGEGNERVYPALKACAERRLGGHVWRQHYDVLTDVGLGIRPTASTDSDSKQGRF